MLCLPRLKTHYLYGDGGDDSTQIQTKFKSLDPEIHKFSKK